MKTLKEQLPYVFGLLIIAGWVVIYFFGQPAPPVSALFPEAKQTASGYMGQFCQKIYGSVGCKSVRLLGKQRWIMTATISQSDKLFAQEVDEALVAQGWTRKTQSNEGSGSYCKGTYGATYESAHGFVKYVSVVTSANECR